MVREQRERDSPASRGMCGQMALAQCLGEVHRWHLKTMQSVVMQWCGAVLVLAGREGKECVLDLLGLGLGIF